MGSVHTALQQLDSSTFLTNTFVATFSTSPPVWLKVESRLPHDALYLGFET